MPVFGEEGLEMGKVRGAGCNQAGGMLDRVRARARGWVRIAGGEWENVDVGKTILQFVPRSSSYSSEFISAITEGLQ